MSEHILTDHHDGILTITLQRPQRKNALTLAMYTAMASALQQATDDPTVRVVLLQGSDGCFTSGNDLQDFLGNTPQAGGDNPVEHFMRALLDCSKPVVAAVQGPAVGIGFTLLLHCDLVYVARDATLVLPFANLGLCPEFASSYLLPKILGHVKAAELLLLAQPLSGEQFHALGLASQCLDHAQVIPQARTASERLAAQPPAAIRVSKALMRQTQRSGIDQAMATELPQFFQRLASAEFQEATTAFFEKRPPDFSRFD